MTEPPKLQRCCDKEISSQQKKGGGEVEVEEGTGAVAVKFDDLLTVTGSLERSSGFLLIHSSCADSLGLAALYGDATDCPKSKGSKSLSGFSSSSSLVPSNELLKKM